MKLPIRTRPGNGFWKEVENRSKTRCDYCGALLAASPGGDLYCDNWELDLDQPNRYETLKKERRGNVTVRLSKDTGEGVYRLEWIRADSGPIANNGAVSETAFRTYDKALANYEAEFTKRAL